MPEVGILNGTTQRGLSMILGMSVGAFTILHVIITLVAIGSGLIVVGGMFASNRLPVTTALFLFTTALSSLTGFLFPSTPSRRHWVSELWLV